MASKMSLSSTGSWNWDEGRNRSGERLSRNRHGSPRDRTEKHYSSSRQKCREKVSSPSPSPSNARMTNSSIELGIIEGDADVEDEAEERPSQRLFPQALGNGGGRWRGRRLSRVSSGDEELRERIRQLTTTNNMDDQQDAHGHGHRRREGKSQMPPAAAPVGSLPYPLWGNIDSTGFENWLTDVKPPPRRRSRKKGSTFGVDEGGDDLFGWRRDLPPFSSGAKFSFEDDFMWLFSAPPKRHDSPDPTPSLLPPIFPLATTTDGEGKRSGSRCGTGRKKTETTYRAEYTPKLVKKPPRASGPKDNIVSSHDEAFYPHWEMPQPAGTPSSSTMTNIGC